MDIELFTTLGSRIELCISNFRGSDGEDNIPLNVQESWIDNDTESPTILEDIEEFRICFFSRIDKNFYGSDPIKLTDNADYRLFVEKYPDAGLSIGLCNDGYRAIWVESLQEKKLISWEKCSIISNVTGEMRDGLNFYRLLSSYAGETDSMDDTRKNSNEWIHSLMKLFTYKILIDFGETINGDNPIERHIAYIWMSYLNGTYDKTEDLKMLNYQVSGKPYKLNLSWRENKDKYTMFWSFDAGVITDVFERFYGAHPETKSDFIVRVDPEKGKYELALFRQGLKEPKVIPESAYQLIVFKNQFEVYRSKNYDQPRGAWIW